MVADGMRHEEILKAYPDLETEDFQEALHFAAEAVREREWPLEKVAFVYVICPSLYLDS
jgi:hypothetical protein